MRSFAERNPLVLGAVGVAVTGAITIGALNYQQLPLVNDEKDYTAYFAEAGGLTPGAAVQVSGMRVGQVSTIGLDGPRVIVKFHVSNDISLGDRTEAAIKTKTLLGAKILELEPRGDGQLSGTIPLDRTTSPYQLPDALGDLSATISGLDTTQVNDSLTTLAQTFANTPPDLRQAVDGIGRLSQSINNRDAQLRTLLENASKSTAVLSKRVDQVAALISDTNALLAELRTQSNALDHISGNISALSRQLQGLIAENKDQLKPALDKLNDLLTIVDTRKKELQISLKRLNQYALSLGEALSSGPYFNAYVSNLLPGQFVQPFIDAAFSDLGLDPNVLLPSQLTDPQTGQPATPALPTPYPRTGQGGEPRLTIPDAITGNQGDQGCGPPGLPLPGPTGCYPYREPIPPGPPGGPPPGPPASPSPVPTPTPVYMPAPNEVPAEHPTPGAGQ